MKHESKQPLILASNSAIRKALLTNAGLKFSIDSPHVNEAALKTKAGNLTAQKMSAALAAKKALSIKTGKKTLVIGADQILEYNGQQYDKARSLEEAKNRLQELSGNTHTLVGTTVLAQNGAVIWQQSSFSHMTMHTNSNAFIDDYLSRAGSGVLSSVGCYEIEGPGVSLFAHMKGDYFSILGLALLPLLCELRRLKALPS